MDVLYDLYFAEEQDAAEDSEDAESEERRLVGVKPIGEDSMVVYLDYWTFDTAELGSAGVWWPSIPWEIFHAAERAVMDNRTAYSQADALAMNVTWLSLINPGDAALVREYLVTLMEEDAPPFLFDAGPEYHTQRYQAAISWIDEHNHALVDNGPFMLLSHDDEAGEAVLAAFRTIRTRTPGGYGRNSAWPPSQT